MKAVILAAGRGRRLAAMGWEKPKCLLPIGGTTLLGNLLGALAARSMEGAVVVVGYGRKLVESEALRHKIPCTFVENPRFATTNTIHSLFLARRHLVDDFLYFNADVWFDSGVLDLVVDARAHRPRRFQGRDPHADAVLIFEEKPCGAEEVKVIVDARGRVTRIGKELPPDDCAGEFIGIARFNRSIGPSLVKALERFCADRNRRDLFFESALDEILDGHDVRTASLGKLRAVEIDTPQDYARAKALACG